MAVDWRNRWGANWISSVRSQGNSQNCWAFAMTALYEAMVRIEHCLWCRRSEGEASRGPGKQAGDIGNLGEVSNFVESFGLADPDCFPWTESVALLTAKHPGGSPFVPLSPTPDREGRIMRAPAATPTLNVGMKKYWIENVGPMATLVTPPNDFGAYGGSPPRPYIPTTSILGGAHALLVIGFDDAAQAWIVKNSWGTGWGDNGFGVISYRANLLEPAQFWGVRGTNPDPNTKRRLRNGAIIQSGNGTNHNNFEIFVQRQTFTPTFDLNIEHWSRDNSSPILPWTHVRRVRSTDPDRSFKDQPLDHPAVVQSTFNRNYELIYRSDAKGFRHVYFDHAAGMWTDGGLFGPTDAFGIPGFIQSSRGAPGDFEVIVLRWSGQAEHWTKHNTFPWTSHRPGDWYLKEAFGSNMFIGGSGLVQTRHGVTSEIESGTGELHYVCVNGGGQMCHWSRPSPDTGSWSLLAQFGTGIHSAPVMIQGQFGMTTEVGIGNLELCVATEGQIQHWWLYRFDRFQYWSQSEIFGTGVRRVLGLQQGPFGYNLELIAERTDGRIQHYFRPGLGPWKSGAIIT
jgi:C1A family cysteine protease